MQYFIVLIDFGGKRGFEAIVHPEDTRRQIVEEVRDVLASDDKTIHHIKFIDGNYICDVTSEILSEARSEIIPIFPSPSDRQKWGFDRARGLRETVE